MDDQQDLSEKASDPSAIKRKKIREDVVDIAFQTTLMWL